MARLPRQPPTLDRGAQDIALREEALRGGAPSRLLRCWAPRDEPDTAKKAGLRADGPYWLQAKWLKIT